MTLTTLADHTRRAAHGKHRCGWCGNNIAAREQYRDLRMAEDGTAWTWREHLVCGAFVQKHLEAWQWDDLSNPRDVYDELVREYGQPTKKDDSIFL